MKSNFLLNPIQRGMPPPKSSLGVKKFLPTTASPPASSPSTKSDAAELASLNKAQRLSHLASARAAKILAQRQSQYTRK